MLREIIHTPLFMEMLRDSLSAIDPDSGARRVRDLLWEDVGLALTLADALPALINNITGALAELARQALGAFPPPLLARLADRIATEIDMQRLRDLAQALRSFWDKAPELRVAARATLSGPGAVCAGRGLNTLVKVIDEAQRRNPALISEIVTRVTAQIDRQALSRVMLSCSLAVLDQRPRLTPFILRLLGARIKGALVSHTRLTRRNP